MASAGKGNRGNKDTPKSPSAPLFQYDESSRKLLAMGRLNLAIIHLREADHIYSWGKAPNACVHAAYYAMHHCAAAAILLSGGVGKNKSVPNSHEHVIQHYAKLVQNEEGDLLLSAGWLNYGRGARVRADYGVTIGGADAEDAKATLSNARHFIAVFNLKWKLDLPEDRHEELWLQRNLQDLSDRGESEL